MEHADLQYTIRTSVTVKLVRSSNSPLIISFLYREFKAKQRIIINQTELEAKLEDYLEYLRELEPEIYPRTAREYLAEWCESQFLRKTFEGGEEAVFGLTPETEKAIAWLEELQKRDEFIGTESRFLQIFQLLKEIQERSTADINQRILQLERDRDRIQQEIDQIRASGVVERYSSTQLQERFLLANQVARRLIGDFQEVEQNFRALTRKVQEAQLEKDSYKGLVVGRVLEADQALKESDQGQSFYAFWNFLMTESKRQQLKSMIQTVYQLEELRPLASDYPLLYRIERNLQEAGEHIVQSNHRLAEKLRQMLDERNLQENRRVAELITEVQRLILALGQDVPMEFPFLELEGDPEVRLVMARPLHPLEVTETQAFSMDFSDLSDIDPPEDLKELYGQFYVDQEQLMRKIDRALEDCTDISLGELLQRYPVTQGLSELVAYLAIAAQPNRHTIEYSNLESIRIPSLEAGVDLQLTLPHITFRR